MLQPLIINDKHGDEYAVITLAVPIDVLKLFRVTQMPHETTCRLQSKNLVMRRSQTLTAFGASPLENQTSVLARHARAKTVCLCSSSIVRLKSSLRHSSQSLLERKRK